MVSRLALSRAPRSSQSSSHLLRLEGIAKSAQQQALSEEGKDLTSLQLSAVERIIRELANDGPGPSPSAPKCKLWLQAPQAVAAYLALFSSALRRSSPFASGDDPKSAYASIRESLCKQLSMIQDDAYGPHCERLGAALLRTDTLQCYSRLLAAASEQLQPAATVLFSTQPDPRAHSRPSDSRPSQAAAERGQRRTGPKGQLQPVAQQLGSLLPELLHLLNFLCHGLPHSNTSDPDSAWDSGSAQQPCAPNSHMVPDLRTHVQSSWVLEHWARVVLLGTAQVLAGADSGQPAQVREMQAVQSLLLERLARLHSGTQLHWSDFVRRPCGCTLAATYMAHLCAALDGGHAFGLCKPEMLALRQLDWQDADAFVVCVGEAALNSDPDLCERGRLISLLPALQTLRAWAVLLGEALQEAPGSVAAAEQQTEEGPRSGCTGADRRAEDAAHIGGVATETPNPGPGHVGMGAEGGALVLGGEGPSKGHGAACWGPADPPGPSGPDGETTAGMGAAGEDPAERAAGLGRLSSLPPFNRAATFATCLRLARIVLARWDAGCDRTSGAATAGPLLPKAGGCVALEYALACARLALLPDIWGRERVPRRTRAQLRAWWETYVAAAQHPEALLVAVPQHLDYPGWTGKYTGLHYRPSADAVAALAAGLLPCMTQLVTRMGAVGAAGAIWCPPDHFPGAHFCLAEVVLFGPLGQVGELLSALGRRLRLAVGELCAMAAGRCRGGSRGVDTLGPAAHEALRSTTQLMHVIFAAGMQRLASSSGPGRDTDGEAAAAAAAGFVERLATRLSVVAAELLPVLSHAVQVCAELMASQGAVRHEGRGNGDGDGDQDVNVSKVVHVTVRRCYGPASTALSYAVMLLVKLMLLAKQSDERAAMQPSGGGAEGGCGGGGDTGGGDAPWRELLLQDVRLMELLGACVELHWQAEEAAGAQGDTPEDELSCTVMRDNLVFALPLAAISFPAEFRAAVGGAGAGAEAGAGPGAGAGVAAAAGAGAGAGPAGDAAGAGVQAAGSAAADGAGRGAGNRDAPPCICLADARELLWGAVAGVEGSEWVLSLVDDVVSGCEPATEVVEQVARVVWEDSWGEPEHTWRVFDVMLTPREARAAVAAVAAAASGATAGAAAAAGTTAVSAGSAAAAAAVAAAPVVGSG